LVGTPSGKLLPPGGFCLIGGETSSDLPQNPLDKLNLAVNMEYRPLRTGEWEIWAVVEGDRCRYESFYNGLRQKSDKRKIAALFTRFVTYGPLGNTQKFRKLVPWDIWEMKPTDQIRLLGFFPPSKNQVFVITHGFRKQQDETPRREIDKAESLRREWVREFRGGSRP